MKLLSVGEAAALLGVTRDQMQTARRFGGPVPPKVGKNYAYDEECIAGTCEWFEKKGIAFNHPQEVVEAE